MTIETDRLILREMTDSDFNALYAVLVDSDIMEHYPYTFDEDRVRGWIRKNIERYKVFGFGLWAVVLKETGEMIGDCGLTMQKINGQIKPEIGYHIRKDCQRRGYAGEAAKAVRDWAFSNTNFNIIYSYMKSKNIPSFRTAIAYGCHLVDEYKDDENEITKVCAISRTEWEKLKKTDAIVADIKAWMERFTEVLKETFGERIYFVGLQGSYGRGEATEASDIDTVVILDELTADDIKRYSDMIDILPNRELICGFLSGKDELLNWEPSDLFQFYNDTAPIEGTLDELLTRIDSQAVDRAVKIGACNIYHGCVHNMLYEKSDDILRGLYKSASFVIQAIVFKNKGRYIKHQKDLLEAVDNEEKEIMNNFIALKNGAAVEFEAMSEQLFNWAGKLIKM